VAGFSRACGKFSPVYAINSSLTWGKLKPRKKRRTNRLPSLFNKKEKRFADNLYPYSHGDHA
jgi:hypothetical protein